MALSGWYSAPCRQSALGQPVPAPLRDDLSGVDDNLQGTLLQRRRQAAAEAPCKAGSPSKIEHPRPACPQRAHNRHDGRSPTVNHGSSTPRLISKMPSRSSARFVFQAGHASSILVTRSTARRPGRRETDGRRARKPHDPADDRRTHGHVISAQTPASRARTTSKYHGHSPSRSSREPPAGLRDR